LEADHAEFRDAFNVRSCALKHNLVGHPLFELPRIVELAGRLPEKDIFNSDASKKVDQGFNRDRKTQVSAADAIARIEQSGSWVVLKRVEQDPAYRELLDQCVREIVELAGGRLNPSSIISRESFVFVTSPGHTTPFHIDPQWSVLLQIRGHKTYKIFDQTDETVISEAEIEKLYLGNFNSATYAPDKENKGATYELEPGDAAQQPVHAPHWAKVGSQFSISYSIALVTREWAQNGVGYRVNSRLRRMGFVPSRIGRSPLKDKAKIFAGRVADRLRIL